jgi:hypothetical protein
MKKISLLFFVLLSLNLTAQNIFRTQVFSPSIKTLQIGLSGEKMSMPVITFNGTETLTISFDEMSHESHAYSYRVLHCNADWSLSSINTNEYLSGFTTGNITDFSLSVNTTFLYTHYRFNLPNDDMSFKISGNYVVQIYEDNLVDKPIAQACFSVVEPRVGVSGKIRGNTDTELNSRLQQLDFDVALNGYTVRDPSAELKVVVRQNNRTDNQVSGLKPTYLSSSKLSYINNKDLIFEGGNEYHRFDISSIYAAGEGVSEIRYKQPYYNAFLYEDKVQTSRTYMQNPDVNGKYVVNIQNSEYDEVDADYMYVHFSLPLKQPFFDGQIYIGGEFNHNLMNDVSRMKYDASAGMYHHSVLLKQGGYNYQYWFASKGDPKAKVEKIDGSYWQTRNEYTVYVYHRPWGDRYDKLVGVSVIE